MQYVEPNGINYYRLPPNYFYESGVTRAVTIQGFGGGVLSVCHSTEFELPLLNSPNTGNNNGGNNDTNSNPGANPDAVTCKQINSDKYKIELTDPCYGSSTISECRPLYISVQSQSGKTSTRFDICRGNQFYNYRVKYVALIDFILHHHIIDWINIFFDDATLN